MTDKETKVPSFMTAPLTCETCGYCYSGEGGNAVFCFVDPTPAREIRMDDNPLRMVANGTARSRPACRHYSRRFGA